MARPITCICAIRNSRLLKSTLFAAAALMVSTSVLALETTGKAGAPAATTTVNNARLPAPTPKFGGVIKDDALNSTAWWAPRVVPPMTPVSV